MHGLDYRATYADVPTGRDSYMVRAVGQWVESVVERLMTQRRNRVIDIWRGAQPFRSLIEKHGSRYVGFDIEQNARSSVDIIGFIDQKLPRPWPDTDDSYDLVLCTEISSRTAACGRELAAGAHGDRSRIHARPTVV